MVNEIILAVRSLEERKNRDEEKILDLWFRHYIELNPAHRRKIAMEYRNLKEQFLAKWEED